MAHHRLQTSHPSPRTLGSQPQRSPSGRKPGKQRHTPCFNEILQTAHDDAADAVWQRAETASALRHLCQSRGRRGRRSQRILGDLKKKSIDHLREVAPELVNLGLDSTYQVGLVSVCYRNRHRLHLPASVRFDGPETETVPPPKG